MGIWPLNPKVMDNKTKPWNIYTITNLNNARSEKDYTTEKEVENNPQWGKKCKTFSCNWNISTSNIWRSTYLQARKWPMLLCIYALEPYNARITTNKNWCCKPKCCITYFIASFTYKTHQWKITINWLFLSHVVTNFKYLNILRKKIMEFGQLQRKSK
jgi:hypothetical protein